MTDLRDRLFDRIGVPRDCGWTDDQIMDIVDSGFSGNTPTTPAENTPRAERDATIRDIAWALNCHNIDSLVETNDDILAAFLLEVAEGMARAQLASDLRANS